LLRGRPCKQGLYLTRCSVFKDQILSFTAEAFLGDNFYSVTCSTVLCKLFFKSFFEAFRLLRTHFIVFSWPELEYTMPSEVMQHFYKKSWSQSLSPSFLTINKRAGFLSYGEKYDPSSSIIRLFRTQENETEDNDQCEHPH